MAQGKVTDFFSARKRNPSLQPSKRRKVEIVATQIDVRTIDKTNTNPYRNLTQDVENDENQVSESEGKTLFSPLQTRAARKAKSTAVASSAKKVTRGRKAKVDPKQKLIHEALAEPKEQITLSETITASWDDHDGPQETPKKETTRATNTRKRGREEKTTKKDNMASDEATPEKRQIDMKVDLPTKGRARKKLQLKTQDEVASSSVASETNSQVITKPEKKDVKQSSSVEKAIEKSKTLKADIEQGKLKVDSVKAKLSKVGNLDDLKSRLAQMKEIRNKIKTTFPEVKKIDIKVKKESDEKPKPKVPAYERFHHLATPAPPTLSLPYKYRVLAEHFRGMDQVVSLLHNRNELCTFSKLKVAVQELTKKNFEKNHVGQIKTVFPEAYELRQEKGLTNSQGMKVPGYQLTVEARLHHEDDKGATKPTFKASDLLTRKNHFHNSLIKIVKHHHKEFLSNLSRPLTIPDDKITRWHPKFPLDEVPDVQEAPLPQPPDIQVYQTARDVLESTRGKLTPKVEAALKSTIQEVEIKKEPASVGTPVKAAQQTPSKPAPAVKGIPQSLLEKIRAKEAANTAAALTRDPKQEKRLIMMKRLPDIMRIIRSQFVTEKKPALPVDSVIQRVLDSYKSCIAAGDVEPHINLCMEVVPEWLSSVQIKKGKYLKIDRNIDLQQLTDKVNNLVKKTS